MGLVARLSEHFKGRAEGRKHPRHSNSYVEDVFGFSNAASGMCSQSQQKSIVG